MVQKGLRKSGEVVIFVPDKSLLPDIAIFEPYKKYLSGPEKNRVKAIKLQKELSCGIILDDQEDLKDVAIGENIADKLGVKEYIPPIPAELAGKVRTVGNVDTEGFSINTHDAFQFSVNHKELQDGEEVLITEKVHGSQVAIIKTRNNTRIVASKGLIKNRLAIEESESNSYWIGAKATNIFEILQKEYPNDYVQIWGELVPIQKGYSYGYQKPFVRFFKLEVNNKPVDIDLVPKDILDMWVPILYRGPYDSNLSRSFREGREQVSGKELHIREGVVVTPRCIRRMAQDDCDIILKIINPQYKESGEEMS